MTRITVEIILPDQKDEELKKAAKLAADEAEAKVVVEALSE